MSICSGEGSAVAHRGWAHHFREHHAATGAGPGGRGRRGQLIHVVIFRGGGCDRGRIIRLGNGGRRRRGWRPHHPVRPITFISAPPGHVVRKAGLEVAHNEIRHIVGHVQQQLRNQFIQERRDLVPVEIGLQLGPALCPLSSAEHFLHKFIGLHQLASWELSAVLTGTLTVRRNCPSAVFPALILYTVGCTRCTRRE